MPSERILRSSRFRSSRLPTLDGRANAGVFGHMPVLTKIDFDPTTSPAAPRHAGVAKAMGGRAVGVSHATRLSQVPMRSTALPPVNRGLQKRGCIAVTGSAKESHSERQGGRAWGRPVD